MELKFKRFKYSFELTEYVNEHGITKEDVQTIFISEYGDYELFYWSYDTHFKW